MSGAPPSSLPVVEAGIPATLKALPSWVCWRYELRGGKWTKPLVNARTGKNAKSNDSSTWTTFDEALGAYRRSQADGGELAGIGLVIPANSGIVGLDFDKCRNPETYDVEPWVLEAFSKLDTFTEVSPSGKGFHAFVAGKKSIPACRHGRIEAYDKSGTRYLTVTGHHVQGTPDTVEPRQAELDAFLKAAFVERSILPEDVAKRTQPSTGGREKAAPPPVEEPTADAHESSQAGKRANLQDVFGKHADGKHGDADKLALDKAMKNADFARLWDGDTSQHGGDASAADWDLCNRLAFWLGKDAARMDAAFRRSRLFRPKWDEPHYADGRTYGQETMNKAIEGTANVWTPTPTATSSTGEEGKAGAPSRHRLKGGSVHELMCKTFEPLKWAIPGVLPAGVALLSGKPKVKKSWLALDIAVAVASGGEALCSGSTVEQGRVLGLFLEDNERRLESRLRAMGTILGDIPEGAFEQFTEWPRANEGGDALIEEWILENPATAKLVVIDTLAKFRPTSKKSENLYETDYNALAGVKRLADKYGVAVLVIHHLRKSKAMERGEQVDFLEMVSGSLGLTGGVDTILVLAKDRGAKGATLHRTGRDLVDDSALSLEWQDSKCRWSLDTSGEASLSGPLRLVLGVVKKRHPTPSGAKLISDMLQEEGHDMSQNAVQMALRRLEEQGSVELKERGRYGLPSGFLSNMHTARGSMHPSTTGEEGE